MIRVLHVMAAVGVPGGIQAVVHNYYKYINEDEIRFDFVVTSSKMTGFEKNFLRKKSEVYCVVPKRMDFFKHMVQLYDIIKTCKYDVIHVHHDCSSWITLFMAWLCGVKVRIAHAHNANVPMTSVKRIKKKIFSMLTRIFATGIFSCTAEAAIWNFGEKNYKKGKINVLRNAIFVDDYVYNEETRENIRNEFGLNGKFVIGNVARFSYQKNHEFLIDVFEKLYSENDSYRLLLVGDGENYANIKQIVKHKDLEDVVVFLGRRDDVADILQAIDAFVFPSRFEGLGMVVVEAQCSNLPCICSTAVPREVDLSDNIEFLPLNDIECWCKSIKKIKNSQRKDNKMLVKQAGYDIETEAGRLVDMYNRMVTRQK